MFDPTSRYATLPDLSWVAPGGRRVAYKARRFPPRGEALDLLVEVTVAGVDRLDLIAARTLGNPELFWRVCDANNGLNPFSLTSRSGRKLRVPMPSVQDRGS